MGPANDTPSRDVAWFEGLFRQHGNRVLAYAARRAPEDADDIVAEVFSAAWIHREKVPGEALPWLYRTAAHRIMHSHRSGSRRAALLARAARLDVPDRDPADPTDDLARQMSETASVARAMAMLPPRDAEVLRLWAWEQLDTDEIAYVLGCTTTTARVRLHRAKRRAEALLHSHSTTFTIPVAVPAIEEYR